ncbi:hypothetical protein C7271_24380 [filamentous cyanobacterium CCP5]|nr:hypothetical protein C7271_24380 [filamentous cyanobacterium CCP5]
MDTPNQVYYLPDCPTPSRDAQGKPAISLLQWGAKGILQLTSQWTVENFLLEELQAYLIQQCSDAPEAIQLMIAPLTIREVALVLNPDGDNPQVLGTSQSSGYPPYVAAFSINLTAGQIKPVIEALSGELNRLAVNYRIALQKRIVSQGSINFNQPASQGETKGLYQLTKTVEVELERRADIGRWTGNYES